MASSDPLPPLIKTVVGTYNVGNISPDDNVDAFGTYRGTAMTVRNANLLHVMTRNYPEQHKEVPSYEEITKVDKSRTGLELKKLVGSQSDGIARTVELKQSKNWVEAAGSEQDGAWEPGLPDFYLKGSLRYQASKERFQEDMEKHFRRETNIKSVQSLGWQQQRTASLLIAQWFYDDNEEPYATFFANLWGRFFTTKPYLIDAPPPNPSLDQPVADLKAWQTSMQPKLVSYVFETPETNAEGTQQQHEKITIHKHDTYNPRLMTQGQTDWPSSQDYAVLCKGFTTLLGDEKKKKIIEETPEGFEVTVGQDSHTYEVSKELSQDQAMYAAVIHLMNKEKAVPERCTAISQKHMTGGLNMLKTLASNVWKTTETEIYALQLQIDLEQAFHYLDKKSDLTKRDDGAQFVWALPAVNQNKYDLKVKLANDDPNEYILADIVVHGYKNLQEITVLGEINTHEDVVKFNTAGLRVNRTAQPSTTTSAWVGKVVPLS